MAATSMVLNEPFQTLPALLSNLKAHPHKPPQSRDSRAGAAQESAAAGAGGTGTALLRVSHTAHQRTHRHTKIHQSVLIRHIHGNTRKDAYLAPIPQRPVRPLGGRNREVEGRARSAGRRSSI
jgi:hypothetical protein